MPPRKRPPTTGQDVLTLDGPLDTQPFFESKRAAAVLKHAILKGYVAPFAVKTGSTSVDHRVAIVDGYAGAGRYDNGEPGSPAIIAEAARLPVLRDRKLECLFIEKDRNTYQRLCQVLQDEDGDEVRWTAWHGTVEDHLPEVLERAAGVPLLLFLDPFGLPPAFDVLVDVFKGRPTGAFPPATEVLFRFDANAIRRIRGVLKTDDYPARAATLAALDRAAGGTWWQDENDWSLDNEEYGDWFINRLFQKITKEAGCAGWGTDVRQRSDLQPAYYLIFLTRHRAGMEVFGEALSLAQEKWRRAVFDEALAATQAGGQGMLLDPEAMFAQEEAQRVAQFHDRLEANVRALLGQHERFRVRDEWQAVFDGVLGKAREKHLREALKRLQVAGVTSSDSKGKLFDKIVVRAPDAQL